MARAGRRQPLRAKVLGPLISGPLAPSTPSVVVTGVTPTLVPGPVTISASTPTVSVAAVTPSFWDVLPLGTAAVVLTPGQPSLVAVGLSPWRQRRRVPVIVT